MKTADPKIKSFFTRFASATRLSKCFFRNQANRCLKKLLFLFTIFAIPCLLTTNASIASNKFPENSSLTSYTKTKANFSNKKLQSYPPHWWSDEGIVDKKSWEILPSEAGPGEVILSKRNELGILSNFALTPFEYRGVRYNSIEGFWQMMKFPESEDDPRNDLMFASWPFTREQVSQMSGFEAKDAGKDASFIMGLYGIDWVSFEGKRMLYRSAKKSTHYQLIKDAMIEKLKQNQEVRDILKATGSLILRPDHIQSQEDPPEWKYCEIWMQLRKELQDLDKQ